MLYITTRNPADSFTAHRVLREDRASDGGMFIPMQFPTISQDTIRLMERDGFADAIARVLNLFFDSQLSGWDIGFSVGRCPIKLHPMNHRLVMAQLWHNYGGAYHHFESNIYHKLTGKLSDDVPEWPRIAIRIAVLFGVHAELVKTGVYKYDIAVSADDFLLPIAAWYARKMGLPFGKIICGCSESGGLWDLIHRGEFLTASNDSREISVIERLLFDMFGRDEVSGFMSVVRRRGIYKLSEEGQQVVSAVFFSGVASATRLESIVKSIYKTNEYIFDFSTASAYGALQDYRARTGESKETLILSDDSPASVAQKIGSIIGVPCDEMKKKFSTQKE